MNDARAYEDALARVCLGRAPDARDLETLGGEAWRWLCYRRLVRARLASAASHGLSRLARALPAASFASLVEGFLAEAPPRSPRLRDVGAEMLAWLEGAATRLVDAGELPPFGIDLARLSCAERRVADAEDDAITDELVPPSLALRPALTRAMALVPVAFAVHRAEGGTPIRGEAIVLAHRDPEALDVRLLELDSLEAALVEAMRAEAAPLDALVHDVCAARGLAADARSFAPLLATLVERGVLRGSWRDAVR